MVVHIGDLAHAIAPAAAGSRPSVWGSHRADPFDSPASSTKRLRDRPVAQLAICMPRQ